MRSFLLRNTSTGVNFNLTSDDVLLHDVSNIGFTKEETYRQLGDRYALASSKWSQDTINGAIAFYGKDPYVQFREFADFISNGNFQLGYFPDNRKNEYYWKKVNVTSVVKTEINKYGFLDVGVSFTPMSPWYTVVGDSNIGSTGNKTFKFPFSWPVTFDSSSPVSSLSIDSDSSIDSPTRIMIYGPCKNPRWTHYVGGIPTLDGKVNITLTENEYLLIDCMNIPFKIRKYEISTGYFEEVYQKSDFTTNRFVYLKKGRNRIDIADDMTHAQGLKCKVEGHLYYDTI